MTFLQLEYLLPIIIGLIVVIIISIKQESNFYKWVEKHWFMKRTLKNKISSILYYLGLILISLALLDLRGPEKNISGKVSDQKTIILIDSSASMTAEDVRPNRFSKALLLAKHYVRKAVGQQISVVVFSDTTKQIIPFTSDMDLVDARLGALENMDLKRGGTALTVAIQESIQYFRNHTDNISGNILIFTDAEETDGRVNIEVPKDISVGVIGVGTGKGAPIPMRDSRGVFKGNKKYQGEVVISKLDESYLKRLGEKVKDFRYWIATSYSLPTEDIIRFFQKLHKVKQSKNNFRIRPVLSNYLMIPGVIFFILSFMFKNLNSFVYVSMLLVCLNIGAQEKEKVEKVKSDEIKELERKFSKGKLKSNDKKYLASKLLKEGFSEEAEKLYSEITDGKIQNNEKEVFNLGASQLKNKNIAGGLKTYQELYNHLKKNDPDSKLIESVKANILKALENMSSSSQKKKSKSDKSDDENKDKKGEKGKSGDKSDKKDDKESKKNKSKGEDDKENEDKKKDKGDKDKNKKNKDGKDKDKKDKKDKNKKKSDGKDKKSDKKKDKKKNKGSGAKPGKPKKMPAILKQLMSDDNQLQKKMIDTGTTKRKTREKRDW
jgi:Ca-activated chloride channel family protein